MKPVFDENGLDVPPNMDCFSTANSCMNKLAQPNIKSWRD